MFCHKSSIDYDLCDVTLACVVCQLEAHMFAILSKNIKRLVMNVFNELPLYVSILTSLFLFSSIQLENSSLVSYVSSNFFYLDLCFRKL